MHEHEVEIADGLIKCRLCGQILESSEKELATFSSKRMAKAMLEEIAVAGKYTASSFDDGFVVYIKEKNNLKEEVGGKKKNKRTYVVYKRISTN